MIEGHKAQQQRIATFIAKKEEKLEVTKLI